MNTSYGRSIFRKGWFRLFLGGLVILAVAFTTVPNLANWMSPTFTRSPALETTPSIPAEGAKPPVLSPPASKRELASATLAAKVTAPAAPALSKRAFWVQVGAFKNPKYAARLASRLRTEHYPVVIRRGESAVGSHLVRVGTYSSRERAEEVRATLETKGFRGFILRDERLLSSATAPPSSQRWR